MCQHARTVLSLVPCLVPLTTCVLVAQSPSNAIDQTLAAAVTHGDVPGVVAMAADRRGVIYHGAFGRADVSNAVLMTTDALFRIASMTKAVTSVAALQLIERDAIRLDGRKPHGLGPRHGDENGDPRHVERLYVYC